MEPVIVEKKLSPEERERIFKEWGTFVKVVVDLKLKILAAGGFLHIDGYNKLLERGSEPENLWGENFYPAGEKIEFSSIINIRPPVNRSMDIENEVIRKQVEEIIRNLL